MGEQTLAARERVRAPITPYTLTSRNNLAIAYLGADRTIEQNNNNVKPANILAPAGILIRAWRIVSPPIYTGFAAELRVA